MGRTEAQDENASEIWEQLNPKWIQQIDCIREIDSSKE